MTIYQVSYVEKDPEPNRSLLDGHAWIIRNNTDARSIDEALQICRHLLVESANSAPSIYAIDPQTKAYSFISTDEVEARLRGLGKKVR